LILTLSALAGPARAHAQAGVPGGDGMRADRFRAEYYAEVVQQINKVMGQWRKAWREDDLDRLLRLYDSDAIILMTDEAPARAEKGVHAFLDRMLPETGEIQASMVDFEASGRLAYIWGSFYYDVTGGEQAGKRITGDHVTLFIRQGRRWKIRSQVFRVK